MKKLLLAALAVVAFFSFAPTAEARNAIIVCDQQGCRQSASPAPIVTNAKIAKHIASRKNMRVTKRTRTVVIRRGFLGEIFSPMGDYRAPLEACGYRVEYASFWQPAGNADAEIAHSMAIFGALNSDSKRVFTIDGPFWAGTQQAQHSRTMNFPTAGHPRVYGANNVPIGGGHLGAPTQAKPHILSSLGCGKKRRHAARH